MALGFVGISADFDYEILQMTYQVRKDKYTLDNGLKFTAPDNYPALAYLNVFESGFWHIELNGAFSLAYRGLKGKSLVVQGEPDSLYLANFELMRTGFGLEIIPIGEGVITLGAEIEWVLREVVNDSVRSDNKTVASASGIGGGFLLGAVYPFMDQQLIWSPFFGHNWLWNANNGLALDSRMFYLTSNLTYKPGEQDRVYFVLHNDFKWITLNDKIDTYLPIDNPGKAFAWTVRLGVGVGLQLTNKRDYYQ